MRAGRKPTATIKSLFVSLLIISALLSYASIDGWMQLSALRQPPTNNKSAISTPFSATLITAAANTVTIFTATKNRQLRQYSTVVLSLGKNIFSLPNNLIAASLLSAIKSYYASLISFTSAGRAPPLSY